MRGWFTDPAAPAWVQAVGSILAILVAVIVPWWQRRNIIRDAARDRARQEKEHLQRLTVGLREEIRAASEAADRRESALSNTLTKVEEALRRGATIRDGSIEPGSLSVTDGTVYKQIAAELGILPLELIKTVIKFYSGAFEIDRVANSAPTAFEAYKNVLPLMPRLKTYAAIVVRTLEKFEASGFDSSADIRPTSAEVRQFANEAGYPLDEIAKERGITLPP